MPVREISAAGLETELAQGNARLIDVRELHEYVDGHVPTAVHIPLGAVPDRVDDFRGDGPVYLVCRSGARSMRACEFLHQFGIDAVNVAGGTLDWVAGGRAVVTGGQPS